MREPGDAHVQAGQDSAHDAEDFADLRLTGGRYERPGFPIAGLSELARYERLLVDVAKALWKKDNPSRERVQRGLPERWQLRLLEVRSGSVIPILKRDEAPGLQIPEYDYLARAKALVDLAFQEIVQEQALPADFPPEAQGGLVRFGSTLRKSEAIVLRRSRDPVRYDQAARRRFLGKSSRPFPVDGTLVGRITAVNTDERTFSLHVGERIVSGQYGDDSFSADLGAVMATVGEAPVVRLEATYLTTNEEHVHSIADAWDVEVFLAGSETSAGRLLELLGLEPGWLDGEGQRIGLLSLEVARDLCSELALKGLPDPAIFPTEEGGVQLEWYTGASHMSVEIDADGAMEACLVWASTQNGYTYPLSSIPDAVADISDQLDIMGGES